METPDKINNKKSLFFEVLLPINFNEAFTYKTENFELKIGDVVLVPFRKKNLWGVVIKEITADQITFDQSKIKEISEIHQQLKFAEKLIKFVDWISSYNLAPKGLVLKSFINILNSDKLKKPKFSYKTQEIEAIKFNLKNLSGEQQKIADEVVVKIKEQKHFVGLIDGVTGSGKTEIYFNSIKYLLEKSDSQILILLPEIALTSQLLTRFETQFGFKPFLWHSKISKKDKREIFYGINNGSVRILIGARSSLLLPFKNLQLIIVDEEHDSSFKQEETFNFNARDMAIVKGKIEDFPVILSSATPSIESYLNAKNGKYSYFPIHEKFSGQSSEIKLIDLVREKLKSNQFISKTLEIALKENLENQKQSLLFINRRGYSPLTLCNCCGHKVDCPNCSSYLVLHKKRNKLICHHCGFESISSTDCKNCKNENSIINFGAGVEKIKEEVENLFPELAAQSRIALMTSDNVGNFDEVSKLVEKISNHEIDIIIGTQLISKGYDFSNLNLVGIVDGDAGFYNSDLRTVERSYQLLIQVMGRVGRKKDEELPAKIFIQTFDPKNLVFEKILHGKKEEFYQFEIENRRSMQMPPFAKMAVFIISAFDEKLALQFSKKLTSLFPFNSAVEVFGPAPSATFKVKNRCHYQLFLKVEKQVNLQKLISDVLGQIKIPSQIRMKIDVDPL